MNIIVDTVFVLTLLLLYPDGSMEAQTSSYNTRADCMSDRSVQLEKISKYLKRNPSDKIYASECVAAPMEEVR